MEINIEEFEFINGYENLYKINRKGEIYSCRYKKIMIPMINNSNYLFINLKKDGKRSKGFIHRLLALQYIENKDNKPEIDHIDRNKKNNDLSNLRWVTRLENCHNKTNHKSQLTTEQLEARKDRTRERARIWAEKNRREKGIVPRNKQITINKDI